MLDNKVYRQAHLSRDSRFDGKFYIGVKTTKVFCRPICPAKMPLEKNVCYFEHQHDAVIAGFRPCLRCRPDSVFNSLEWNKKKFVVRDIAKKMQEGEYLNIPIKELSSIYSYSDRYLRKIFQEQVGCKIKDYQVIQKALFARKLLMSSNLTTLDISLVCGYNSLGAFYSLMKKYTNLFDFKKRSSKTLISDLYSYELTIPENFNWDFFLSFHNNNNILQLATITKNSYSLRGKIDSDDYCFTIIKTGKTKLRIDLDVTNLNLISIIYSHIKRMLDIDSNIGFISSSINSVALRRIPGFYSIEESNFYGFLNGILNIKKIDIVHVKKGLNKPLSIFKQEEYKDLIENLLQITISDKEEADALIYMDKFTKVHYYQEVDVDMDQTDVYKPWRSYAYISRLKS